LIRLAASQELIPSYEGKQKVAVLRSIQHTETKSKQLEAKNLQRTFRETRHGETLFGVYDHRPTTSLLS
jgi:hypothetical protein